MRTYQNERNMLQTSKTYNNALHIDAVYNLKLIKTTDSFTTINLFFCL
jgi:hypothetical protein